MTPATRSDLPENPTLVLAGVGAFVAVSGWSGALALATGGFDELVRELPGQSHLLAAAALACCVAVPATAATSLLVLGRRGGLRAAELTAVVLVAWVLAQAVVVGPSYLEPVYLATAVLLGVLAVRLERRVRLAEHRPS